MLQSQEHNFDNDNSIRAGTVKCLFPLVVDSLKMSACENLVNEINGAVAAAYRLNKVELKDVHKQMREGENILRE